MSQNIKVLLILTCVMVGSSYGQEERKQSIYLELLGNGGLYSINYELNIYNNYNSRIGVSYYGGIAGDLILFPIMVNHFKKDARFSPEFGFGFLIGSGKNSPLTSEREKRQQIYVLTATIGIRFVSSDNQDLIRIAYTPFYSLNTGKYLNFGGLSFGIRF